MDRSPLMVVSPLEEMVQLLPLGASKGGKRKITITRAGGTITKKRLRMEKTKEEKRTIPKGENIIFLLL